MTYYKLTYRDGKTKGGMDWSIGKTNRATGKGKVLCTDGYLHVYDTPEQAVFMQLAHVSGYTRCFEVRSRSKSITDGTKRGLKSCTVVREIELPTMTAEQRTEIAIRASLLIDQGPRYVRWAKDWLSGKDRSADAADAAYAAYAAYAAVYAAASAAYAAYAAVYAAASAAYAAYAASAAAYAAYAASAAASAAASVADAASAAASVADAAGPIPLVDIIKRVIGRVAPEEK